MISGKTLSGPSRGRITILVAVCILSSVVGAGEPASPSQLAIPTLENLTPGQSDHLGQALAEDLATSLHGKANLGVVERKYLQRVMDEKDLKISQGQPDSEAIKAGRLVGAVRILVGSYLTSRNIVQCNIRLLDVSTGQCTHSWVVRHVQSDSMGLLDAVRSAILKDLGGEKSTESVAIVSEQGDLAMRQAQQAKENLAKWGTVSEKAREYLLKVKTAKTPAEEIKWATKAIEIDPNYAKAYNNRAVALADLGQFKQAMVDINRAIAISPNAYLFIANRADFHWNMGMPDKALADANEAVRISLSPKADHLGNPPQLDAGFIVRAEIQTEMRRFVQAASDWSSAIQCKPEGENLVSCYIRRGYCYLRLGRYAKAESDFTMGMKHDSVLVPSGFVTSEVYAWRAECRYQLGDREGGVADEAMSVYMKNE